MTKIEYKIFKTKSKLSSLLTSVVTNPAQKNDSFQTISDSYYILTEFKSRSNDNDAKTNENEDGMDSIWFNRSTGQVTLQKSNYKNSINLKFPPACILL